MDYKAAIFDLDGVLVDTASLHYLAWKQLADELKIPFTEKDNERLKGISRIASLEIMLSLGNYTATEEEKKAMAQTKNSIYTTYLQKLTPEDVLSAAEECLIFMRQQGIKIVLGSASKNARLILERVGLYQYFDVIVDGNMVSHSKPDPEVFLRGAQLSMTAYPECVVFEDSIAGIKAAKTIAMHTVGIGSKEILTEADIVVPDLKTYLEMLKGANRYVNI